MAVVARQNGPPSGALSGRISYWCKGLAVVQ